MTKQRENWKHLVMSAILVGVGSFATWSGSVQAAEENGAATAEESSSQPASETEEAPADSKSDEVKLTGLFQAVRASGVAVKPEEWSSLVAVEAVEHGAEVQRGDVLLRLERDKLERAIEETKADIRSDELTLKDAEIKLELAKRSQKLALEAAKRADRIAVEEMKDFVTEGRDASIESAKRSIRSAKNRLEYQEEELHQLEKMYAADDLTEETEEIILKRTRDAVDSARYSLEVSQRSNRLRIDQGVPRTEEELEGAVARAALALEEARRTAPQSLKRQRIAFEKQTRDLEQKRERLQRLRADLKRMEVTAPQAGVVYFGRERRGKWSDPDQVESMVKPGGTVKANTVLMTVVQLRPLTVRVTVPEASLRHVSVGTPAQVEPVAYPDMKLKAKISSVSAIPIGDGQFDAVLKLTDLPESPRVVPGMKANVLIKTGE